MAVGCHNSLPIEVVRDLPCSSDYILCVFTLASGLEGLLVGLRGCGFRGSIWLTYSSILCANKDLPGA